MPVARQHEIPAEIRALDRLPSHYIDLFIAATGGAPTASPETWARATIEDAPAAARFVAWRVLCGFELAPSSSADHIGGWQVVERTERAIRLEASSRSAAPQRPKEESVISIDRVGEISITWGESLRWDEQRQRLYFVDCATQTLHWLDGAEPPLQSLPMPGLPTGLVLCEDGRLIAAVDDGLHVVDTYAGTTELLTPYPARLGGRANDAAADLDGNLVTGTLNIVPGPGSYWWYSTRDGWRHLDDGIGNANGPVVLDLDGAQTLVFADTQAAAIYAYPYYGPSGEVGERRLYADTGSLGGLPDGACADDEEGVWSCVLGAGLLARYSSAGLEETISTGVELPSDATFGGPGLDRLFVTSIAVSIGGVEVSSPNAGALLAIEGTGRRGRTEPRFKL